MVCSGINHGANLGDDVLYSGTVAAAMEGRHLGLPAIALSLAGSDLSNFDTAGAVALSLVKRLQSHPLPKDTILNVNVPDLPINEVKGFLSTRLGDRHQSEPVIQAQDPSGREIFWVGPAGQEQDCGAGTDFDAIRRGYVSVTPLKTDLTHRARLDVINDWLPEVILQ
jgi:5'-nucleotidase